jgi:dihydroorotase, multifunctional complex type
MEKIVIKNGTVLVDERFLRTDVLVENGRITAIGQDLSGQKEIDAANMIVVPGLIDAHVHLREPGQTAKEDIASGTRAAAHGGYTTVCAMANVSPVPNCAAEMKKMCLLNAQHGQVRVLQYAPVTENLIGERLTDFSELQKAGAFAVSNDGHGIQSSLTTYQAFKKAAAAHMMIAVHAQDDELFDHGVINQGPSARALNLRGIPAVSETSQVARDLALAQQTGVHYHVCHVSTKETVELIRAAKSQGVNVTCEVTPHHLLLSEEDILSDDSNYKMNPPLRSKEDQQALIAGLLDGTIDIVATDHAPHTKKDKAGGFAQAAFGITGSETAFSMLYTKLVKTRRLTLEKLVHAMSITPADILKIDDAGKILPGMRADLAIFDLQKKHELITDNFLSKAVNSPFAGQSVWGETVSTLVKEKLSINGKQKNM